MNIFQRFYQFFGRFPNFSHLFHQILRAFFSQFFFLSSYFPIFSSFFPTFLRIFPVVAANYFPDYCSKFFPFFCLICFRLTNRLLSEKILQKNGEKHFGRKVGKMSKEVTKFTQKIGESVKNVA